MKFDNIYIPYYPASIYYNIPLGYITLTSLIQIQQNPDEYIKSVFQRIVDAEVAENKKLKDELKQNNLHYYTPCVHITNYRRYTNIIRFTGLMVLDFDHLESTEYSQSLKEFLFNEYRSIIAVWLSPSKHGIKALVSIPIAKNVDEFKSYFFGIAEDLQQFEGWDGTPQNAVLPLFQSYDPSLLFRTDYTTWDEKPAKMNSYKPRGLLIPKPIPDITIEERIKVYQIIQRGFEAIYDNGHPQVRSLCLAVGGYVAGGFLDEHDVKHFIWDIIESHQYLKKDPTGYFKTAEWAIVQGKRDPLHFI